MDHQTSSVSQIAYHSPQASTQPITEFPKIDLNLVVSVFSQVIDPIAYLNKAMAFLIVVASSRFPLTNNQLRTSFNPRNQATIQDDKVTARQFQVRQGQSYAGTGYKGNATSSRGNNTGGHARTEDLDAYDSNCDDVSNAKAVLMVNLYNYGSDVILEEKANQEKNNELVNAKLDRYKEKVKTFEQRLNIDLSSREKMIDSLMDDMIKEKLALKQQINSLEQNLSNQIKEKESLFQTFIVFKNESKEKETKYMENEIDLEKKIKELNNIVYKVALGYQNPFYLKKAQQIKPTLYDGSVISSQHVAMPVIDDDETLILEEVKLLAKQAFWFHMSNPTTKSSDASPVKVEAPSELPKVSLVNESLKKLKFHLAKFDFVVKIRTTPNDLTEDLLNEITEVQTVFNQMEAAIQQCSIDKQCFEIVKKELFLENDRLLQKIMSQDVLLFVMNSITLNGESVNMNMQRSESCDKCFNLDEEKVNHDISELETINEELENSVAKLLPENERLCKEINHVKQVFKDQFDSIKKTRARTKEQSDSLIAKLNLKSVENEDLKAQIQDKLDLDSLAPRLLQNREAHIDYLKDTQEQADILQGIVKLVKAKQPLDALDFAFKKVRFSEPLISSSNIKQVESSQTSDANTPMLSSIRLKCSTSTCRSKPTCNKKNDRISQPQSSNMKNKIEAQHQRVNLNSNKKNRVVEPIRDADVKLTPTKVVPANSVETSKPNIKVYSRRPKQVKNVSSSKKAKIVESKNSNNSKPNHSWGSNATDVPSSSSLVNDRVYYVDGLGHNLFSVGQFCDADFEVAFQKNTCFIQNLEGVDLLLGSRDTNLYTISLDDMLKTSLICLLSKASKTKSWLWHHRLSHHRLSHLNFACALGKSKKSSHQPKAEDTTQEKLYLLHMDLCGPMRVESINGKNEAPEAIIKCIKNIQVPFNATVCNVRTDNGTEFVNQTLRDFYENVNISYQTSVAHTPQQNDIVKRRNQTLIEATRTMLIFLKAPLFPWAEAINTPCYTQNRSLIRL
ncbi:retrovirus-related pol polyprotein from transposon TNT 1-94 [Tanacetum coccineum]